jgi:NAD(P)-dependent dehydrogenase (short-subunit alcohol dehydrogenase family)
VTKAAVVMLGKMLALDGGQDGVRSNVLCPGDIWPGSPVIGVWRLSAWLGYREHGLSGAIEEGFMGLASGSRSADA